AAAGRALWHAACPDVAGDGAREPRHAHVGGGEEGRGPAAQAHRADDPVLPPGAVHPDPGAGRDPRDGHAGPVVLQRAAGEGKVVVIPGRAEEHEPGTQTQTRRLLLDSGSALTRRPE